MKPSNHSGRRGRSPAVAVAAALALAGCGADDDNGDNADNGGGGQAVSVTAVEVDSREIETLHTALGTVATKTDPRVAAEVGGRIEELTVDEGDRVAAGDVIARLDPTDYEIGLEQADAEIDRLQARIRLQEATVARNQALQASDYVSAQELDEAEAELDTLREELVAARLMRRSAERDLARTEIRAPFDAAVEERLASEGDYAQAGRELYHLATDTALKVRVSFPETLARELEPGMTLHVHNRSAPQRELSTQITEIRPVISEGARAVRVIAAIDNPGGWRSGASVNAEVVTDVRENVTVPNQALVRRPDGETVYVLDADEEVVEARQVEPGRRTSEWVEIREGLEAGERVAVDGAGFLTDGASVSVTDDED